MCLWPALWNLWPAEHHEVFKFNAPFQKKCILSAYCWVKLVERILTYTPTQKFFEAGVNQHFHIFEQHTRRRGHLHSVKLLLEAISSLVFHSCSNFFNQWSLFSATQSEPDWNCIFEHVWSFSTMYITNTLMMQFEN